jgi:hypothetical protein
VTSLDNKSSAGLVRAEEQILYWFTKIAVAPGGLAVLTTLALKAPLDLT